MPDERTRTESSLSAALPPPADDGEAEPPGPYERFIGRAAALPWWAIILLIVAVGVVYSMLTSAAYRRVLESLTDDPQISTDDKFDVVQIVGEDRQIIGQIESETPDSVSTVIRQLLTEVLHSERVTRSGFVESEDEATVTVRTDSGLVTIPKSRIVSEERTASADGTQITINYIERVTVTGVMTEQDDDTMTVRTVDEVKETFDASRVLSREACDPANPDCDEGEETILRQGEIIEGNLNTVSNANITVQVEGGDLREFRRTDVDYFHVPTLTIALYEPAVNTPVEAGSEVRLGFVEGTDITGALDELDALDSVPVPLRYSEGDARVVLVAFADVESAMQATAQGDVSGVIYLDSGDNRLAVADWVNAHEGAGVVLPQPPAECDKDCAVTVKLKDQELTGRIEENGDQITMVITPAEYMVLDKDQIIQNRSMKPGVCALNNLRGCNAGIFLTLRVTFMAYALAVVIGLFVGLMRVQTNPFLYAFSTLYVEVVRGIPLLVILLYAGFVISPQLLRDQLGINLSDEQEAIFGLSFGYGAFIAEIFRAGIQSISRGQMEAARSLGMSYPQAMRFVVLPQAVRVVLPPLGNDFISMLKDSALISVLALPDLLQLGRLYVSRTFRAFEGYNSVAILYLAMTLFLSMMVRIIERRTRLPR
jgi:polar amino acid transport system permease protein